MAIEFFHSETYVLWKLENIYYLTIAQTILYYKTKEWRKCILDTNVINGLCHFLSSPLYYLNQGN